jgi:hypothetical protein
MDVTTRQVLQREMGNDLPAQVRRALLEMGTACNTAAVHLHGALTELLRVESEMERQRNDEVTSPLTQEVGQQLQRLADQHFEQAVVVLARVATSYAVYASQVAAAVGEGQTPPPPGTETIRPSDLITACGLYLPELQFLEVEHSAEIGEQNTVVRQARNELTNLIYTMQGESVTAYDEIATVAITTTDADEHRLVEFADALHAYASTLVWAIGVVTWRRPNSAGA